MKTLSLFSLLLLCSIIQLYAQSKALENAHAHNDYAHSRPLFDALDQGFTSIEADVHLIDGELYVSHDHPQALRPEITLKRLYLDKMQEIANKNNGRIYPGYNKPVYLLIDIKTDGKATYEVLAKQLKAYSALLNSKSNPEGAVKIVISGNRPIEFIAKEPQPMVGIDGRPDDLAKNYPIDFMPIISENFNKIIKWDGKSKISSSDYEALKLLAEKTHQQGKLLRLWATPENENTWETLLDAGVDFLNTDQLERLGKFLGER